MFESLRLSGPWVLLLLNGARTATAQNSAGMEAPSAAAELTGFNSSLSLAQQQIQSASLTPDQAQSLENAYNFEYSQYAGGSTDEDAFYDISDIQNGSSLAPGTLLRSEDFTNLTNYSLAPNVALSRILYVSENLNGSVVPASAFILWPFSPRKFSTFTEPGAPVVVWNHPTSGFFGPAAPSKHRTLWIGDNAVFPLALAGYAVVAPDFVGLGVSKDFNGNHLAHQYLSTPVQANDGIYAFIAAKTVFGDRLTKEFVVMGHSQGGGSSWGFAELMARKPELSTGYLGAVAASPAAEVFGIATYFSAPFIGFGLSSVFPDFSLSDWLTPFGLGRANLLQQLEGGLTDAFLLFTTKQDIVSSGFLGSWYLQAYAALSNAGRKPIAGPLLVIQGTSDPYVSYSATTQIVDDTCTMFPDNQIQFQVINGTGHVPTLDASRQIWMSWIEDRFNGKTLQLSQCGALDELESFLPLERYQAFGNSPVVWAGSANYSYQVPLGM